jgi:hypothetical protein
MLDTVRFGGHGVAENQAVKQRERQERQKPTPERRLCHFVPLPTDSPAVGDLRVSEVIGLAILACHVCDIFVGVRDGGPACS